MENNLEVMQKTVELSETIIEGLLHMQKLLGESKFEQTINMFEDILVAFASIERSFNPLKEQMKAEAIEVAMKNMNYILELVVDYFEEKNYGKVQEVLQFTLVPKFKGLKTELEKVFKPFLTQ